MEAASALTVVQAYLDGIAARDWQRARGCLADRDFKYVSPLESYDSADRLITSLMRVDTIMKDVQQRRAFSDGDDVCIIMDFRTTLEELAVTPLALWATVRDGKIGRLELFFDARAYMGMFGA